MKDSSTPFLQENLRLIMDALEEQSSSNLPKALKLINKAIRDLLDYNKERATRKSLLQLANAYCVKGSINHQLGEFEKAESCLEHSQTLFKRCDPDILNPEYWHYWYTYAKSFEILGDMACQEGNIPETIERYKSWVDVMKGLSESQPKIEIVGLDLLAALDKAANYGFLVGYFQDSLVWSEEFIQAYEAVKNTTPDIDEDFVRAYDRVANISVEFEDFETAERSSLKSISLLKEIIATPEHKDMNLIPLALCYNTLGKIELSLGDFKKSKKAFKLSDAALDKNDWVQFSSPQVRDLLKLTNACDLAKLYEEMGAYKKEMRLLKNLFRKIEKTHRTIDYGSLIGKTARPLYLNYLKLCTSANFHLRHFQKTLEVLSLVLDTLFTWYDEEIIDDEIMAFELTKFADTTAEMALRSGEGLKEEDDWTETLAFTSEALGLLRKLEDIDSESGIVDQEKISEVQNWYMDLRSRLEQ